MRAVVGAHGRERIPFRTMHEPKISSVSNLQEHSKPASRVWHAGAELGRLPVLHTLGVRTRSFQQRLAFSFNCVAHMSYALFQDLGGELDPTSC